MTLTVLIVIAIVAGLYMAWNIGANDVANAFGTSVGSGALTLKRAILLAAIFEFAGAFFVGAPVAKTMSGEIVPPELFSADPHALGVGMLAALLAASVWLNIATCWGQPVSTTHAIIGAIIGFAVISPMAGPGSVAWFKMGKIAASWIISPLFGGLMAYAIYRWGIRRFVLNSRHPVYMAMASVPIGVGWLTAIVAFSVVYKGLPRLKLNQPLWLAACIAAGIGLVMGILLFFILRRRMVRHRVPHAARYEAVERWFGRMQIATACYMAFAHGANDVANAIGPLAASIQVFSTNTIDQTVKIPAWLLGLGGAGIVLGLATYGYKVIEAIGSKITEMTPTRGAPAEFGTATSVLVFSKLGMPISTTFVIVGAVMGVGFARGFGAIDLRVIRRIFASWLITIPASAVLCAVIYWTLMALHL